MSVCCDRSRSVTWGIFGGLPSNPHGNWLNPGTDKEEFLGAFFSNVAVKDGDSFTRPSAGGGGLGDPLKRQPEAVLEDVIDDYVSIERAKKDYGVIIKEIDAEIDEYEILEQETLQEREYIRLNRKNWLEEDVHVVHEMYKQGEIDHLDLIRRYGVLIDFATGEVLNRSTEQFREMLQKRSVAYWD
jgi:N-methylhydantoinase B